MRTCRKRYVCKCNKHMSVSQESRLQASICMLLCSNGFTHVKNLFTCFVKLYCCKIQITLTACWKLQHNMKEHDAHIKHMKIKTKATKNIKSE